MGEVTRPRPKVVYIGGYGRSGSTLLDMILGSHPELFSLGEVSRFFDQWIGDELCSCGRTLRECEFWTEVMGRLRRELPGVTEREAASLTHQVEGISGALLPRRRTSASQRYGRLWSTLLRSVTEATGAAILVDSSKTNYRTAARPVALAMYADADVQVVHLVRDPRGVMWSFQKGSNERLERGEDARLAGGAVRGLLGWSIANVAAAVNQRRLGCSLLVRYEDLAARPETEVARIGASSNFDAGPILEKLDGGLQEMVGHGVAGNRLRRSSLRRIEIDLEWANGLSPAWKAAPAVVYPLTRRYGYRLSSRSRRSPLEGPR